MADPQGAPPSTPPAEPMPASWEDVVTAVAQKYQVDPRLALAVAKTESSLNPAAVSSAGARGLMQLMPATAKRWGVNIDDPHQNIIGGVQELKAQLDAAHGDVTEALRRYNAGPQAPTRVTDPYVQKVLSQLQPSAPRAGTPGSAADPGLPDGWEVVPPPAAGASDDRPGSSSALALAAAVAAARRLPAGVTMALASPNAPRIIQRAIGAGVRGASTAVGGAVGGVPGAVVGATLSQGLTPTQQTVRGWLGRDATNAATTATNATTTAAETGGDAVTNYITAMGGDVNNLKGAALEYAKKAGRPILYDAAGRASLVTPAATAAETATAAATAAAPTTAGRLATFVKNAAPYLETAAELSGAQSLLDWAQAAEPNRRDIGFFGIGPSSAGNTTLQQPTAQLRAVQYLVDTRKLAPMAAARAVTGNNPQLADQLLTLYTQARAATK